MSSSGGSNSSSGSGSSYSSGDVGGGGDGGGAPAAKRAKVDGGAAGGNDGRHCSSSSGGGGSGESFDSGNSDGNSGKGGKEEVVARGPYLCTNYDIYLSSECCTMCAMALVHSRIGRVFFRAPTKYGAFLTQHHINSHPSLNHHFKVFTNL